MFYAYAKSKYQTKNSIPDIKDNENDISDNLQKAKLFNDFFTSVFTEENKDIPTFELRTENTINNIEITPEIILTKLKNLNTSKSPGIDNLHPKVLSETAEIIAEPLYKIFQQSLSSGKLPQQWKQAIIIPSHKKGKRNVVSNYRPISLTSIACKVLESIIKDQLLWYLMNSELISPKQHGFVPNKSCFTNLLTMLDFWTDIIEKGHSVDCIYLDFAKAFDSVPHQKLIQKLKSYGINGSLINWITEYLNNRQQSVRIENSLSSWSEVISGVPQGSVLGPLLFVLFINDLPDNIESLVLMFADDTKIYQEITDTESSKALQRDLYNLFQWSLKWQLKFNSSKCKVLHIGGKNPGHHYDMPTYDSQISLLECFDKEDKDLGIHIDPLLKFTQHTVQQVGKANRIMAIIRRSFCFLDKVTFKYLFCALVRPHLEYCITAWYPTLQKNVDLIESVLRRGSKLVDGLGNLTYEERLRALDLPSMKYRLERGDLVHVYKILSDEKNCLKHMFEMSNSLTRGHEKKIVKPFTKSSVRLKFFANRVINSWNSLPKDMVNASSVDKFKELLDYHWRYQKYIF